jgi:hypothetical protein
MRPEIVAVVDAVPCANPVFEFVLPATAAGVPSCVVPLKNVTVPVGGAPKLCVLIVAVKLTIAPDVITDGAAVTAVVVAACVTDTVVDPVFALKLASPEYDAFRV